MSLGTSPRKSGSPKQLVAPTVPKPAPKLAPKPAKPAAAGSSIPVADGEHVQWFQTLRDRKRTFHTVPVQKKAQAEN